MRFSTDTDVAPTGHLGHRASVGTMILPKRDIQGRICGAAVAEEGCDLHRRGGGRRMELAGSLKPET